MYLDVVDLRDFYGRRLGLVARRLIGERLKARWPSLGGESLLGIGYATPYLRTLGEGAERTLAFMPATQGVVNWPREGPNAAALVAEDELPLSDASIDRVLVIHSLEVADNARDYLREIWRVLAPGGRVLIVVPQRSGMWARSESTPFGYRPSVRADPADGAVARDHVLAARVERGAGVPAVPPPAVAGNRGGVGAGRAAAVAGGCRRHHRRGEQAALSGRSDAGDGTPAEARLPAGADPAGGVRHAG